MRAVAESERPGMGDAIACACGCGETFREYDDRKRRRRYLPGHQIRKVWRDYLAAVDEYLKDDGPGKGLS